MMNKPCMWAAMVCVLLGTAVSVNAGVIGIKDVASAVQGNSGIEDLTLSNYTVTAGSIQMLVVGLGSRKSLETESPIVAWGTQTLTRVPGTVSNRSTRSGIKASTAFYILPNVTAGTFNLSVDFTVSNVNTFPVITAMVLTDVEQSAPTIIGKGNGGGDTHSATVTTTQADQLIASMVLNSLNSNYSASSPMIAQVTDSGTTGTGVSGGLGTIDMPAPGTQTATWTSSAGQNWASTVVVFNPIPEPASLALLGLGGMMILRRGSRPE